MPSGAGWLAAIAASRFLSAGGGFRRVDFGLMARRSADPDARRAGAARHHQREFVSGAESRSRRDAAIVTFLMTASGAMRSASGSAFWGLVLGGYVTPCFTRSPRSCDGVMPVALRKTVY